MRLVASSKICQKMLMRGVFNFRLLAMVVLVSIGALVHGCSKKGEAVMNADSFNSASPELKEKWKAAADYSAKKNYLGAATNLMVIISKSQELTAEQNDALSQAWMNLGNQAFAAANQGDKVATEAVLKMKEVGYGERRVR